MNANEVVETYACIIFSKQLLRNTDQAETFRVNLQNPSLNSHKVLVKNGHSLVYPSNDKKTICFVIKCQYVNKNGEHIFYIMQKF